MLSRALHKLFRTLFHNNQYCVLFFLFLPLVPLVPLPFSTLLNVMYIIYIISRNVHNQDLTLGISIHGIWTTNFTSHLFPHPDSLHCFDTAMGVSSPITIWLMANLFAVLIASAFQNWKLHCIRVACKQRYPSCCHLHDKSRKTPSNAYTAFFIHRGSRYMLRSGRAYITTLQCCFNHSYHHYLYSSWMKIGR